MKGVSLAIETIVFIILAVTVLSVLLLFFSNTGIVSANKVELENKRNIQCGKLVEISIKCDTTKFGGAAELQQICKKLDVRDANGEKICETGNDMAKCLNTCCNLFCSKVL